ncbi:hypothetical protein [Otoolea muris]|uniref:hypothetical protein n=1 Tax=Otoolea muris TaxID=2941515 RepID=UPI00203FD8FD|nr:hypothetical protein [Otoolea muris]
MKNNRRGRFWVFTLLMLMSGGCSKKLENPEIKKVNFQTADHGKMIPELSDLIRARLKGIWMKGLLIYNNSEEKDGSGIEKSIGETETNIYNDIMNQYIDAVDKEFPPQERVNYKREERWSLLGDEVDMYLIINAHAFESYKVYYALYDVDGNGTPELFIGGPWGRDTPPVIYDFFTFDGKQAISPFREAGYVERQFGYRVNLYFYSNGIFEVDWSNGAMNYGVDFYRLSPDGYNVYPVESVSVKVPYDLITRFYHDAESEDEISEKEYNAILQKYMAVGEADLNWSEIVKE